MTIHRWTPKRLLLTIFVSLAIPAMQASAQSVKMYWGVSGSIQRANVDGSDIETLVTNLGTRVPSIALDSLGGKMYWSTTNETLEVGKIQRANLDGTHVEDLVSLSVPFGIALDLGAHKLYWAEGAANKIQRANLDGSNVKDVVTGLYDPYGIALDVSQRKIYWTDFGSDTVSRAQLDGSSIETLISGLGDPVGICILIQPLADKLYIAENENGAIIRSNFDGSEVEGVVSGDPGLANIALDPAAQKIYWTNTNFPSEILRANLDGSAREVLVTGLSMAEAIALLPSSPASSGGQGTDDDSCAIVSPADSTAGWMLLLAAAVPLWIRRRSR